MGVAWGAAALAQQLGQLRAIQSATFGGGSVVVAVAEVDRTECRQCRRRTRATTTTFNATFC